MPIGQTKVKLSQMNKIPFPITVDFALTGKCNLRCKHCNTADTWNLENELSFDEIIGLLDQLKEEKVFNMNLFGGEPFFYPRIFDLIEALNDYPIRVTVLTNGTLIDENTVRYLKKMRFLDTIQVSIDGSTPEVHDWQRGKGSFECSMKAVRLLKENGLPIRMKAVINSHSYKDITGMVELAQSLGFHGMDFGDAVECGRAAVFADDISATGQIHKEMMKTIFDIIEKYPDFSIGGTLGQKRDMLKDFYQKGPGKGSRGTFSTCPAGQNMMSIRSDGKVVPCSSFWTLIAGDTKKNTLREIWDTSKVLNEIRALADEPLNKYDPECTKCDYLSYCNGGCRAAAYYTSGNNLKGIDKGNCLVFSSRYGCRLPDMVNT